MKYAAILAALSAAVTASPLAMPQGVTEIITPPSGPAPTGCSAAYSGTFGIVAMNITGAPTPTPAAKVRRQAQQSPDGQIVAVVSQIGDGQIQGGMHTVSMVPVSQISDGQIQGPVMTPAPAASQIGHGQPQAPTPTASPVGQSPDAQPTAPPATPSPPPSPSPSPSASPAPSSGSTGPTMAACKGPGTLSLALADGILKDQNGRTGYIASNFQFQFDDPPQAGALYTAGFSFCGNGSLALGGSNVFWQCLSGSFYNLYDRNWAAQCSPVTINALQLLDCPAS